MPPSSRIVRSGMSLDERLRTAVEQLRFWEELFDVEPAFRSRLWLAVGLLGLAAPPEAFARAAVTDDDVALVSLVADPAVPASEAAGG